ncbi:Bug family tripartite tricarboxylate transporter substrate binding protein [Pararoseomonas indoligenes]|uniref:Tripartite tricarboxylate transporter substrate binding protein n=1 Tax=Roseomonas indoligenes TaxID=2820811 RepID=A0A940N3Y4_9PROT|nr:tripartite tricarboxylate transporter substrate binding protein [Pararoseomonas indoligenes]MBP0495556.1 tripartite tricarboxylate transporter substrate binding protein [Pararoseomonas indoligenes]
MTIQRRTLLAAGAGLALAPRARAEDWPTKPVRVVVPYAPGGGTDIFARALAESLRTLLGQPVVVENRAGGNGVVGAEHVMRSPGDGTTFAVCTGAHVINKYSMRNIPFHPVNDFTPIALLSSFPLCIAVNGRAFRDLAGMMKAAKEKPGSVSFGTTEAATSFAGNNFARMAGLTMTEVPYRGSGPMLNDVIAGHLPTCVTSTVSVLPYIQDERVRVLAVTSDTRSLLLPEVPTIAESGVPGYEFTAWYGMYAPPGLPAPIAQRMATAIQDALKEPALKAKLLELGADVKPIVLGSFATFLQRDDARWAQAAREGLINVSQ